MRHKVFGRKLNRDVKERKALFKSLVIALIKYGKIKTTLIKAKAVCGLVEKLVTKAKNGSSGALIGVSSFLGNKELVQKLNKDIAPRFANKMGGYVRIIKVGKRVGDSAEQAIMEWTVPEEKKKEVRKTKIEKKKPAPTVKKTAKKENKK